ncbi:hypothetical protein JXM67_06810 [candidate division WOR-3 bacterium]|nr:hypothetical protein [candidate division WOR-3 bacterium]
MLSIRVTLKVVFVALLSLLPLVTFAGWERTYGDNDHDEEGKVILETNDGNYLIFGSRFLVGDENHDIWILKINAQGDTLWTKTYGGDDYEEMCRVELTNDGGYIMIGGTHSYGPPGVWLLKFDSDCDTVWTRIYPYEDGWGGSFVFQTRDSGYMLIGTHHYDGDSSKIIISKVDLLGNIISVQTYGNQNEYKSPLLGVCKAHNLGFLLLVNIDSLSSDHLCFLLIDEDGNKVIVKGYVPGAFGIVPWFICDLERGFDYEYVLTGISYGDGDDGFGLWNAGINLYSVDEVGDDWANHYTDSVCFGCGIHPTRDSAYIVNGSGGMLFKTQGKSGGKAWVRYYKGILHDVFQTPDEGYLLTGYKNNETEDLWLFKVDSLGNIGVLEEPVKQTLGLYWDISKSVGSQVVLNYADYSQGFNAEVFDASGRRVDELHSSQPSGTLSWGEHHGPGVYFIKPVIDGTRAQKVVLVR